jgi:hypothetical protein
MVEAIGDNNSEVIAAFFNKWLLNSTINGIFRETHQNHQIFSIVHNCNNA